MVHILWLSLAIPVIIHLVYRRKAKPLPFSTLYFLRLVDQRVHRRYRLKELLLLALRLLLLAALVGAFVARRHGTPFPSVGAGHIPTTVAIVLDNTCSMRLLDRGSTVFDRAKRAALDILDGLSGEDAVALVPVDSDETSAVRPTTARAQLRTTVAGMEAGHGTGELSGPIRRAIESLKLSINARKELYIITDMQKLCWAGGVEAVGEEFPKGLPAFLVDVGMDATRNLAITGANWGGRIVVTNSVASLYCEVQNTASRPCAGELSMFLGDEKVQQAQVELTAGGRRTVVLRHTFRRMGEYTGRVELGPDELPADNIRFFTVEVRDKVPVLIVNGAPSIIPYRDGAFYLRLALEAPNRAGQPLSPIRPKVVTERELLGERLDNYACVILANVARIGPQLAQRLAAYVRGGGGLLVFCGNQVDPASYNLAIGPATRAPVRVVHGEGETGGAAEADEGQPNPFQLLPGRLGQVQVARAEDDAFFHVTNTDPRHPILQDIVEEISMKDTQVRQFIHLEKDAGETGGPPFIGLDAGPLFAERKVGAGTVILCTTSCTADWSNLPLQPYFLPLLHRIVYYVGRSRAYEPSTPVGMACRLRIGETNEPVTVRFYPPPTQEQLTQGVEPEPVSVESEMQGGENSAVLLKTERPGIYRAEVELGPTVSRRHYFAVNVPARESDLERLSVQEARRRLGVDDLTIVRDAEELRAVVRRAREGLPLWDFLLLLTIVAAVCETYVSNVMLKH